MTPRAWARLTELFDQAVEAAPSDRDALLAALHRDDPEAARELASLLEAHRRPGEFLPALPAAEPPDLTGRVVGAYRLLRPIGSGGAGAVYLAERSDGSYDKQVAVKLLSTAFLQSRDRFLRERTFLARLEHPNIARLIDAGTMADHVPYLVMEYVDGVPIDQYCAERQLPLDARVGLLLQACAGIADAHRNLILHCDIKPANILVTPDGTVKLLDFGIARLLDSAGAVTLHRPATPAYSSPEQLGGGPLTTTSDVYSLGVLAYVMLTGHGPYAQRTDRVDELVHAVLTAEPRRASLAPGLTPAHARRLRGDLDNILAKATAKDRDRRYATVEQFAEDLQRWRHGYPVHARPATVAYRLRRTVARHRMAFAVGGALSVALLAATVFSTRQAQLADRRFEDLRSLAHTVLFEVNDQLAPIPGTTAVRKLVAETALQYLDRLAQDDVADPSLREELAAAYIRIGKVQGGAFMPNLGDSAGAVASFRKAISTAGVDRSPAVARARIEALINVALLAVDPVQAIPDFDAAISAARQRLAADASDAQSLRLLAEAFHGRATMAHLTNDVPGHMAMATRQVEVREQLRARGGSSWQDTASLARAVAQLALALGQQEDDRGSLAQLQRARAILDAAVAEFPSNQVLLRGLAEVRSRMVPSLVALGRPDDAANEAGAAVELLEPLVASDPLNVQFRADLSYAWLRLGDARIAQGREAEALDLHRRALTVRRERALRYAGFIFVPWELTRSLNAVGDLLLRTSPADVDEAAALFAEARTTGERALDAAPSFTQVRKQVAVAEEGLARAATIRGGAQAAAEAAAWRQRSVGTQREIVARSVDDGVAIAALRRLDANQAGPTPSGDGPPPERR